MSLQFIIGSSGSGKSITVYDRIISDSMASPDQNFFIIVPEQFTMQTQKTLVERHPDGGILNIDVLSFQRLAHRIFEEVGGDDRILLEETGKSMVLQKVVQRHKKELPYLGGQMNRPGYLDEVKSLLSEFMQYDLTEEELETMAERAGDKKLLQMKIRDVGTIYRSFKEYLKDHYITAEEVLDVVVSLLPLSKKLLGSVMVLDGFTGFTPVQIKVIRDLLSLCQTVYVTVTMDPNENPLILGKPHQLFYMSRRMIHTLSELTRDIKEPVMLSPGEHSRFAHSPALGFLEKNLFRYNRSVYEGEQQEIRIFSALSPQKEMEEAARRMQRLVREKHYRYGEMAVITGNLQEYGSVAEQVFREAGIPCFLDQPHTVMMNPFVEYLRSAVDLCVQGFSYECVFRYLRCGMSNLTRPEIDELETYVLALGIRGINRWREKWVRTAAGIPPEKLPELNDIRQRFLEEVEDLCNGFSGGGKTVEDYCRALYAFIEKNGVQEKLLVREREFSIRHDKAMEKEYAQIYGIILELLDKMVAILGREKISRRDFRQLLETGMAEAKIALIPPSMDQVLVGDMERTRLKDVRALFFVGVNEGNIPKNTDGGGLLTELDREFFADQGVELAPGPKELMNMQRFYLYLNLTKPSEMLTLSFARANGKGEALSPAYLITTLQNLFPSLEIIDADRTGRTLDAVETPGTSLDFFLEGLSSGKQREGDPVFSELYSWYLNSPEYQSTIRGLVDAAFARKPSDRISQAVAEVLYGEVSPHSATRLEKFAACAFAHFLQYGLRLSERAEYEFRALDLGNVMHGALEGFSRKLREERLEWKDLEEEERNRLADEALDEVCADYGNTILYSSASNAYAVERARRLLHRTVWALQEQLRRGAFEPEGFEVSIGGGRIDRLDVWKDDGKVYVKVIDYKTGSTSFDLLSLYHGLQLQLMVYLDGAMEVEQKNNPQMEVEPAGVFYYNIKDPLITEQIHADAQDLSKKILKELKMNGLVNANPQVVEKLDSTLESIPVGMNKDGSFAKASSVATREQFAALNHYVKKKISSLQQSILDGEAGVEPYELREQNACTYCAYRGACGFDRKLPGYDFRRLKNLSDRELWKVFEEEDKETEEGKEEESRGSAVDRGTEEGH